MLLAVILLLVTSCIQREDPDKDSLCSHSVPVAVSPGATNGDEYLYTITYTDLDYFGAGEIVKAFYDVHGTSSAACSSVRNGKYHGRNLDYYIPHSARKFDNGRMSASQSYPCAAINTFGASAEHIVSE